jgi:hypothetical protein
MSQYYSPHYKGKRRTESSGSNILTQLGYALVSVWKYLFKKQGSAFDQAKLLAQFSEIEGLLKSNDSIHAAQAVVRADSFLDNLMKQVGGQGASFADRLRSLEKRFSLDIYQTIWTAHKLRNTIAHEQITISVEQAQSSLKVFRRAASQLGAF